MDWFPLINSLRVALVATAVVFCLGIWLANLASRLPRVAKGALDVVLTLPLVLPPTVVGYLLLLATGPRRPLGAWAQALFGMRLTMVWYAA
ncbi:MAG: molybdate ABC transporter permease subunit, partial [Atopobiaceae bacterium]|nr:molybdate ABC transporter permease subunit [Atopobiaceae bacterium]